MKSVVFALSILFASVSHADIIRCTFTEPFVNSTYSMTESKLTYVDFENKVTEFKNVSFQIKGPALFELVAQDGTILQTLNLNNNGSDGMSDYVFPYEVKDSTMLTGANGGIGGCTSNYLHKQGETP